MSKKMGLILFPLAVGGIYLLKIAEHSEDKPVKEDTRIFAAVPFTPRPSLLITNIPRGRTSLPQAPQTPPVPTENQVQKEIAPISAAQTAAAIMEQQDEERGDVAINPASDPEEF